MKTNSCAYTALSLLCLCCPIFTAAADTTKNAPQACERQISLDEFRAYALKTSPLAAEIDRDYALSLATAFETEVLSNPELQAAHTSTRMKLDGADDAQIEVSLSQPLRISNFGSRSEVAKLMRKSSDLQKRAKLLEFALKLNLQYRTLSTYQRIEKALVDAEMRASKKVSAIREGVKQGLFSEGDENLFEGETYRLQAQVENITSTIAVLQSELAKSADLPCPVVTTSDLATPESLPSKESLVIKAAQNELGESSRIDVLSALTKEQVRLAELDAIPQITPRFIYQHTNDGGDFFGAGISVALPFWNRNEGEKLRARAEHTVAQSRAALLKSGNLRNQIAALHRAAASAHGQSELFSSKVVPAFEKALRAQEKLYAEGKGNVLQVWQTLRAFNEVQTQGLQIALEAMSLRIQLSVLVGEEV